jgi:acetyl-CoA acetyltransferase family protein
MTSREVVFVDGVRTAFGRMGGTLKDFFASQLAGIAIAGLLKKTKVNERAAVDGVFLGSAAHCSSSLNPARWATLAGGLGYRTPASYVEMQCGSAIDCINHAAWKILAGQADIMIAGGMESYSQTAAKFSMSVAPYSLIPPSSIPQQLSPAAEENIGMGLTAENLQEMYKISREAQDEFSYRSQMRAKNAIAARLFDAEIIPVMIPATRKTPEFVFRVDEYVRPDTKLENLLKLAPAFKKNGTVTAGNSSGRNDGAAFVLMMTKEKANDLGYHPLAQWIGGAEYGVDPRIMGIAPAYAIPLALKRTGLNLSDLDIIECNEAFAVQNLAVIKELENQTGQKLDIEKWNPLGGAIAFGHPNGASGARICMFAMRELNRRGGRYAAFSSCCGGGLGVATLIKNIRSTQA